ncbi:MAG: transglycosylase domain-containing protein [Candidatus Howiella sp.]
MSNRRHDSDDYEAQFPSRNEMDAQSFDLNSFASRGRQEAGRKSANGGGNGKKNSAPDKQRGSGSVRGTESRHGSAPRRSRGKKPKKKRGPAAKVGRIILSIFLIFVITGCLIVGTFAVYVFGFVDDTLDDDLNELKMDFTTTLYVKSGDTGEYVEYQRLHGEQNRIWISIDQMPEDLINAYIAIEDKRFLSHNGVDWKRTISAFANMFLDLYSSNQGGSTITQQLVKNLTGDNDQRPMRKIREIMRARYVENNYTKETIIECYLNTIALANGIYGVEVASNYYFGKSASELDVAECATLAAMAKEPERYRPDENPEDNKERRLTVLFEMYDQGLITAEEYEAAKNEEVVITASRESLNETESNTYFVDTVIDNVIHDLMDTYGYDQAYASNRFYNGGYKIYCTLDPDIQSVLDTVYTTDSNFAKLTNKKNPDETVQSAMTVMDYEGHIVGIVGGRGQKTGVRELNRAYNVARQPGSTMKPIAVYAPALESNLITYSSKVTDQPIQTTIGGRLQSWPKNSYSGYIGTTNVKTALERSINTVPVRILQDLTLEASFEFLTSKMGITTLDEVNDLNLGSLALGGSYKGITPTELTAAFATFGNLGKYYKPTTYTKITDQYDEVVLEPSKPTVAIGEDTANIMNKLLQNVIYGGSGTGTAAQFGSLPLYGKTGTTSDNNDRWFVGGSPYYIAACWYGFDTPYTLNVSGNPALTVWKKVMSQINTGLEYKDFPQSNAVVYGRYCTASGMAATDNCSSTAYGWFKASYRPACTTHGGKLLDAASSKPSGVNSSYSGGDTQTTSRTSSHTSSATSEVSSASSAAVSSETSSSGDESAPNTSEPDTTSLPEDLD